MIFFNLSFKMISKGFVLFCKTGFSIKYLDCDQVHLWYMKSTQFSVNIIYSASIYIYYVIEVNAGLPSVLDYITLDNNRTVLRPITSHLLHLLEVILLSGTLIINVAVALVEIIFLACVSRLISLFLKLLIN